jgi:DtxR family Mn-dependent transcriptional regulator
MVKKLSAQGLVSHVPYGAIILTAEGTALALRMLRRHRLIETWLVKQYGYRWDEVHDEAEILEHALSDRLLEAIDAQLGHPTHDPHGDAIPTADGRIVQEDAVLLRDAPAGSTARVVRISDRDPLLLQHLEAQDIALEVELAIVGRKPFGGALVVRVDGGPEVDLGEEAQASIWVSTATA